MGGVLISDGTVTWIVDDVRDMTPVGCVRGSLFLPKGYIKANGATVQRTDYPRLVHFIESNNLWTDDTTTNAGLFGKGDGNSTFVLPDYRERMMQYTEGSTGAKRDAGLPNVYGYFRTNGNIARNVTIGTIKEAGYCMNKGGITQETVILNGNTHTIATISTYDHVTLDAHSYNPIYGSSATVQPPAINVIPILRY